jgi:hypothetical protein
MIKTPQKPMMLLDTRNDKGNGIMMHGEIGAKGVPFVRVEGTARGWRLVESVSLDEAIQFCKSLKQWVS